MSKAFQKLINDFLDNDGALSPAQCRAARGMLNWTRQELAKRSKIAPMTLAHFEQGIGLPRHTTTVAIAMTLYAAGIRVVGPPKTAGPGVFMAHREPQQ